MFNRLTFSCWVSLGILMGSSAYAQQTVNVSPGDDVEAAIAQAGAGGTVVFAPGTYALFPNDIQQGDAVVVGPDLAGITFQGAGPGFDPNTASILDGNAGFLGSAFEIEADNVTVDGFTITNFWDDAVEVDGGNNVEIRNCWIIANDGAVQTNNEAGLGATLEDISQAVRFRNCVIAKGSDIIEAFGNSFMALINCDIRDSGGDIFEPEEAGEILVRNCIIDRALNANDIQADGSSVIEIQNSVFYNPGEEDGVPIDSVFDLSGATFLDDASIFANPLYTNVNFDVSILDWDFTLQPGSPALTAGIDENGNPTFAGSAGPAQ